LAPKDGYVRGRSDQMLYRMSTHLLDGNVERHPAFVDGRRQKQELPRRGDSCDLLGLALILPTAVDGADARG
jgi:hypothetical protein